MHNSIYRIVNYIGSKFNILILSPSYRSFGDSVEQIYFALLHCQSKNKKLILIRPFKKFLFKKISISNIYLYQLEHELIYKPPILIEILFSSLMTFLAGLSFLEITGKKLIAKFFGLDSNFLSNFNSSYAATQHFGKDYLYSFSEREAYTFEDWQKLESKYKSPDLPEELIKGSKEFIAHHAPDSFDKKWIVIHVLDNTKVDLARGADIQNYDLAIDYLIEKGFYVFRFGDKSMPRYQKEGLLDLAHIEHEYFLDLYLIKNASLFIGNQSGPAYATNLFNTNLLATNLTEWSTSVTRRQKNFFTCKNFYYKSNNKRIPISEMLTKEFNFQVNTNSIKDREFYLVENTKIEILKAVEDHFRFKEDDKSYTSEQLIYNKKRRGWLEDTLINDVDLKIHYAPETHYNYIRIRSMAQSSTSGTMAQSFLKKYWN